MDNEPESAVNERDQKAAHSAISDMGAAIDAVNEAQQAAPQGGALESEEDRGEPEALAEEQRRLISAYHTAGKKVITVLVSGRPLVVTEQINQSTAFVAAWLPGSEGQGIAEVLFGDYGFSGKLGFSWPRDTTQIPIRAGDKDYDPLYPFGFGLRYQERLF